MKTKMYLPLFFLLLGSLILSACAPAAAAQPASAEELPAAVEQEPTQAPAASEDSARAVEAIVRQVVEWNVEFAKNELEKELPRSPFVSGAYRETGLFSQAFTEKVERILDIPESWGEPYYDPILDGFGLEFDFAYEVIEAGTEQAVVVVHETVEDYQRDLTLLLENQEGAWKVGDILEANLTTPEGVAKLFYDEYLFYQKRSGNPYADRVYRTSPYLTPEFIAQVERLQAESPESTFDPFVAADSYPPGVQVVPEKTRYSGDQAEVTLRRYTSGLEPDPLVATLEQEGWSWKIGAVRTEEGPQTPGDAVQAFYQEYLGFTGGPASEEFRPEEFRPEEFRNPLVERAYRASEFLAPEFVEQIDQLLDRPEGIHFDPFLCAQDIPAEVIPSGTFLAYAFSEQETLSLAKVAVQTSFADHWLTVDLKQDSVTKSWQIQDITCGQTPQGRVYAFYTWYMGCEESGFNCRAESPRRQAFSQGWITEDFAGRIEALEESFRQNGQSGYDPLLLAQAYPSNFSTELISQDDAQAVVALHTEWGAQVDTRLVTLVMDGGWKIDEVSLPEE